MKTIKIFLISATILISFSLKAAEPGAIKKRIIIDLGHGQKFWSNPATMKQDDKQLYERAKYLTSEMEKVTATLGAEFEFHDGKLDRESLGKCDLLFIQVPTKKFSKDEVAAVDQYLQKGGSMYLVMDEDYWSTLKQTRVNELIKPFGIEYKSQSPDTINGGYSKAGSITSEKLSIPFHGARIVEGGTPFCYNKQSEQFPFGVYKQLPEGGKLIVMGDGMVSLFMTSWKGEKDYQCRDFMHASFKWLLGK